MKLLHLILALFATMTLMSAPVGAEGSGIGIKPANPDPSNKRTESIFVYNKNAGDTYTDEVEIINSSDASKSVRLYAVDATVSTGGAFACSQAAEKKLDAGSWIRLANESHTLSAQSSKKVAFRVNVPKQAAPGEHGGCLVIEEVGAPTTDGGNGITLSFRSAVRVSITVAGDIRKSVSFVSTNTNQETNQILSQVALRNSGNVSTDISLTVILKNLLGKTVAQNGGEYPLLAASTAEWNYELKKPFWGGIYYTQIMAKYNNDPMAPIGKAELDTTLTNKPQFVFVRPQPVALAIELFGIGILLAGSGLLIYRRITWKQQSTNTKSYTVKSGETINDIADARNISWKQLAKINNLKAPYVVRKGQKIRVPKSAGN